MESTNQDPEPRPASTLVLLRTGPTGLMVLITQRPQHLRFMGGALVFPGGAVAESDLDPAWERASALDRAAAARRLGVEDEAVALGALIAALREAHEEVGLLGNSADAPGSRADLLSDCLRDGIVLATDRLIPAGHWTTPAGSPIRFDTRFFVTEAPDGWEPRPDPSEVEDCFWAAPSEVLDRMAAGEALMAPPTVEMLQRLATYGSVQAALHDLADEGIGPGGVIAARLSPLVQVVLAPNPGLMTGPGTNTYIVGRAPSIVIDPAVHDEGYLEAVLSSAGEIGAIVVTHRHPDHVGGTAVLAERTGAPIRAFGTSDAGGHPVQSLADEEVIESGGVVLRALHTPGHASDHLCLYLEGTASLFAGDNVLGEGTAVIAPPDGNMADYLRSLERLSRLHIDRIYPGHFRPLDGGRSVIEGYIAHRRKREQAILAACRPGPIGIPDIVAGVYTDTPEYLHPVAEYQVLGHLQMLADKGLVEAIGERWAARVVESDDRMI